jgi:hypothetical protein
MTEASPKQGRNDMAIVINKTAVRNLGWLFKHASQVTELHFKKQSTGDYLLKAIINCGEKVFETTYASKEVFCEVFNRNRTLQGVVCFFDDEQWQAVGELGHQSYKLIWSPTGQQIAIVEARSPRHAVRLAPKPYRKYLGEIYAELA